MCLSNVLNVFGVFIMSFSHLLLYFTEVLPYELIEYLSSIFPQQHSGAGVELDHEEELNDIQVRLQNRTSTSGEQHSSNTTSTGTYHRGSISNPTPGGVTTAVSSPPSGSSATTAAVTTVVTLPHSDTHHSDHNPASNNGNNGGQGSVRISTL